jgi:hypothetical protein
MSTNARWYIQLPDRSAFLRPDGAWDPDPANARRWPYAEARCALERVQYLRGVPHAALSAWGEDQPAE